MELLIFVVVSAVYSLLPCNGIHEFGSSRGAIPIHIHMSGYLVSHANEIIDAILAVWSEKS
jgi:hypothetical protein